MTELLVSVLGREEVKYPDSSLPKPIKGNYYFFFHLLNLNYVIVVYGGRGVACSVLNLNYVSD